MRDNGNTKWFEPSDLSITDKKSLYIFFFFLLIEPRMHHTANKLHIMRFAPCLFGFISNVSGKCCKVADNFGLIRHGMQRMFQCCKIKSHYFFSFVIFIPFQNIDCCYSIGYVCLCFDAPTTRRRELEERKKNYRLFMRLISFS